MKLNIVPALSRVYMETVLLYFKNIIFKSQTHRYQCKEQKMGSILEEGGVTAGKGHSCLILPPI